MQHLVPVTLRRLRIAAARLRTEPRRSGIDRAIWIAARNHRRDLLADPDSQISDPQSQISLPVHLVDRINELANVARRSASYSSAPDHPDHKETTDDPNPDAPDLA